ncbi:MAG: UDP-N-acetylglucosamine 2-epimerase (non-hydrolyzing) [Bacteroidota bacterium]
MIKILTVVGARPQFVKAAVVSREIKKIGNAEEVMVHTGQHYDENMSEIFFSELEIPKPQYNLALNDMDASVMTGRMMEKLHGVVIKEKPDWVLVYGDTNSTLAGGLVAKQNRIKLGHVEAGLRSHNMSMLEELNRITVDRISDVLFCPTDAAMINLRNEGYDHFKSKMILSGDVMYDAALYNSILAEQRSKITERFSDKSFILVTLHRSENVDNPDILSNLVDALNEISKKCRIVLPLHPRTKKRMQEFGLSFDFNTIEPVGYLDMIRLLMDCKLVMTDGGGLQKEAYFFSKHCITLRERTEWTELVKYGYNVIVGSDRMQILKAFDVMSKKQSNFSHKLYGDGNAGKIIVETLLKG